MSIWILSLSLCLFPVRSAGRQMFGTLSFLNWSHFVLTSRTNKTTQFQSYFLSKTSSNILKVSVAVFPDLKQKFTHSHCYLNCAFFRWSGNLRGHNSQLQTIEIWFVSSLTNTDVSLQYKLRTMRAWIDVASPVFFRKVSSCLQTESVLAMHVCTHTHTHTHTHRHSVFLFQNNDRDFLN